MNIACTSYIKKSSFERCIMILKNKESNKINMFLKNWTRLYVFNFEPWENKVLD